METETNLVFANTDTGTLDPADRSAFVLDLNTLSDGVRDRLFGDDFFDEVIIGEVAESHGVSVSDLWAAWEWRRHHQGNVAVADLWAAYYWRRDMVTAGILADVEDYVVRLHGERADGWRFDESDDAWHHCDRRAYWDDNGVTCSKCQTTMAGDQEYDNAHRCDDCGVTGGGVVGGVCQDCDGERQRNGGES